VSLVGVWVGGVVSEIHKPQVWIERADTERALPVINNYEQHNADRRAAERGEMHFCGNQQHLELPSCVCLHEH